VGSATRQGVRAQARVLAGGLRARGTHRVCGRSSRTLLVCGDRLGWAGSGSVGDAAAACSAFGFFLGAAFFAAGAFRLGGIAVQRRVLGRPRASTALGRPRLVLFSSSFAAASRTSPTTPQAMAGALTRNSHGDARSSNSGFHRVSAPAPRRA
jgi:hypothetical protein